MLYNDRRTPPRGEYGIKEIKYQNSSADILYVPAVVLFQKNIRVQTVETDLTFLKFSLNFFIKNTQQNREKTGSFFFFHQKKSFWFVSRLSRDC